MVITEQLEKLRAGQVLETSELQSIEDFARAHPYSPTIATIRGKALKIAGSAEAESSIKVAALLSNNRAQLHEFIFQESSIQPAEVQEQTSEDVKKEIDPLEQQIISAAIGSGAVLDLIEDEPDIQDKPEENVIEEPAGSAVDLSSPKTFSEWMSSLHSDEIKLDSSVQELTDADDLIDRFIENEEEVVPKRAEFFSPSKAAKKSTLDNEEIVSETLASIYASQGEISKAISTYNKLSLLYPEKSSYFAGLIQKLKEDKNIKS